tara:strand:- start:2364 stop:2648 length:285 start_codon:yes stop_codon:yes gene_type:complete
MEQACKIDDLEKTVNSLEIKIDKLINLFDDVKEDTGKMSNHIDFINSVYSRVSAPLFWICDKVNSFKATGIAYSGIEKTFVKYNSEAVEKTIDK